MAKVGTSAWNEASNGLLRRRDRAALIAQAVSAQLRALGEQQRRRLGLGERELATLDLDNLRLPDTAAAREAQALCAEVSPPFLTAHCHRTYLWGEIFARRDGIDFDQEMLYVAALLHDLGLTERFAQHDGPNRCFAHWAAGPTRDLCGKAGWPESRSNAVVEAISLHLNPVVGLEHGAVAHLLGAGAACDVAGVRAAQISRKTREAVLARHPKGNFSAEMPTVMSGPAGYPGTRAHLLLTVGQLEKRMRRY